MKTIFMETDQVFALAEQIKQSAEAMEGQVQYMASTVATMNWQGASRDIFVSEFEQIRQSLFTLIENGLALSQRLRQEVEEWLQADSMFGQSQAGMGGIASAAIQGGHSANQLENNMASLAKRIMDLNNGDAGPIEIVKIGDNEYVVLLAGTKEGQVGHNWGSALIDGGGLQSDYQLQVKEAIEKYVPEGATLHFAGHSQGGIVANNLSDDQDILNGYTISSVTTFGSPQSDRETPGVDYNRYAANWDPVPMLDRKAIIGAGAISFIPGGGALALGSLFTNPTYVSQTNTGGYEYRSVIEAHGSYSNDPGLGKEPLPFTIKEWDTQWRVDSQGQPQSNRFTTQPTSSLTLVEADLFSGDSSRQFRGAVNLIPEVGKVATGSVISVVSDSIEDAAYSYTWSDAAQKVTMVDINPVVKMVTGADLNKPVFDSVARTVDSYTDQFNAGLVNSPTLTEATQVAYNYSAEHVGKATEFVSDHFNQATDIANHGIHELGENTGEFFDNFFKM